MKLVYTITIPFCLIQPNILDVAKTKIFNKFTCHNQPTLPLDHEYMATVDALNYKVSLNKGS